MTRYALYMLPVAIVLAYVATFYYTEACNEAVCASLVSKCILLKDCGCEVKDQGNCTCCKNCTKCLTLSNLYVQCCSCVGICPKPKFDDDIYKSSTIEDLAHPVPELFTILTDQDEFMEWKTYHYPTYHTLLQYRPELGHFAIDLGADPQFLKANPKAHHFKTEALKNCTVAYLSDCTSLSKCKTSCKSMGASKMRWFNNDGCCQCIGSSCLDYGMNESKCQRCSLEDDYEYDGADNLDAAKLKVETANIGAGIAADSDLAIDMYN
ncbi:twisted gastrulation protein homolog 1-A-like [Lineus longissimus]|uniref:twisted gastrulation protein homolog 1-A-like n=1 Tax=Lineus longissimus TaxID=88925 RepID=UPI002B4EA4D4